MILPKPETTTRLVFANVNGLGSTGPEQLCILDAFRALDPSIIGITETQLDTTKYETTTRPFLRHVKSLWQHNSTLLADSKETFTNSWKPRGVAQIVVGGSKIRLRKADRDPSGVGRWVSHTLVGTNGIPFTIITSYRVSQSNPLAVGALTAAQQQWRHLARHNQPNPDPRTHFISDIIKFIKQLQRNHHDIYLMGESEGAAPIQRIYNECNLVSVFHPRPEEAPRNPTYIPAGTSPDHHACTPRIHQLILLYATLTCRRETLRPTVVRPPSLPGASIRWRKHPLPEKTEARGLSTPRHGTPGSPCAHQHPPGPAPDRAQGSMETYEKHPDQSCQTPVAQQHRARHPPIATRQQRRR
jgi:hypothetical protein